MATVGTGSVEIVPDLSKFRANVEKQFRRGQLRKSIQGELAAVERTVGERMGAIGSKLSGAGSALTRGLTLPIVGLGVVAAKSAIDFETSFAGVKKTVEGTEKQFAALSKGLRDMAKDTGTNVNQLNAIAEAAGALGIKTTDILAFVDVVNKLDVATDLTAESAATSLGKLKNVLDLQVGDLDNLSAAIVDLGNKGSSTEPEIVELALRIAAAGKNAGFSASEVLAFSAAVADAGIQAEAGGTAISQTLGDIAKAVATGKDLKGFAKIAGQSAADFSRAFKEKPALAVASFIEGLQGISESAAGPGGVLVALEDVGITGERQVRTLQTLSGAQTDLATKIRDSAGAYKDATAAQSEFDKLMQTSGKKIDKIKATFADVFITLGERLIPVIERMVDNGSIERIANSIAEVAEAFGRLSPGKQELIVKTMLAAVALGPALSLLGGTLSGLSKIIGLFRTAKTVSNIAAIGDAAGIAAGAKGVGGLSTKLGKLKSIGRIVVPVAVAIGVIEGGDALAKGIADKVSDAVGAIKGQEKWLTDLSKRAGAGTSGSFWDFLNPFHDRMPGIEAQREISDALEAISKVKLSPSQRKRIEAEFDGVIAAAVKGLDADELEAQMLKIAGATEALATKVPNSLAGFRRAFSGLSEITGRETTNALGHLHRFEDGSEALAISTTRGWVRIGEGFRSYVAGLRNEEGNVVGIYRNISGEVDAFIETAHGIDRISLSNFKGNAAALGAVLGIPEAKAQSILDKLNAIDGRRFSAVVDIVAQVSVSTGTGADLALLNAQHDGGQILHGGGPVTMHGGGRLRRDERLIRAQTEEFMIRRPAARVLGLRRLNALNDVASVDDVERLFGGKEGVTVPVTLLLDGKVLARTTAKQNARALERLRGAR